jgi:hypothetical protein
MKTKINYIVEVNGKVVKSGVTRVDLKKLRDFERGIIAEYTKRPGKDIVEVKYR